MKRYVSSLAATAAALAASAPLAHAAPSSQGGGFLDAGLTGEYFANASLTGTPAFVRKDVRLDFDWSTTYPVGGSSSPGFAGFPTDNYSVRWNGALKARFSETYTFTVDADDGARVYVWQEGSTMGAPLIDQWTTSGTFSGSLPLQAGVKYNVRVEYRELTGAARLRLFWQSPSTPEEIIDPVAFVAVNAGTYWREHGANAFHTFGYWESSGYSWRKIDNTFMAEAELDAQRWPLADFKHKPMITWTGTYRLRFKGKARVDLGANTFKAVVSGTTYTRYLPKGIGYDAATGYTEALVNVTSIPEGWTMAFTTTERTDGSGLAGVTDVSFMVPRSIGATEAHPVGQLLSDEYRKVYGNYVALRHIGMGLGSPVTGWADRSLPTDALERTRLNFPIEKLVMISNETGRDLFFCTPVKVDDAYFDKLAKLLRYGSDGVNPYEGPVANPVFPPLNPNLRVYLEYANEVWNYHFNVTRDMARAEVANNTAVGRILNFDNDLEDTTITAPYRYWAYKSIRLAAAFSDVWGQENLGRRYRPIHMWQYGEISNATESLYFMDRYFANSRGEVTLPNADWPRAARPVHGYLFGGGGAGYYKGLNDIGVQPTEPLPNFNFSTPDVPSGVAQAAPAGAGWSFTGTAGIYDWGQVNPDNAVGYVPIDLGTQSAFVQGTGTMTATFTVTEADTYWIAFRARDPETGDSNMVTAEISGTALKLNENGRFWTSRNNNKPPKKFCMYSSETFTLAPGTYTLKISGLGLPPKSTLPVGSVPGAVLYIDGIHLGRLASFHGGSDYANFPATGSAAGQPSGDSWHTVQYRETAYSRAWGLTPVMYEAGWSLAGDTYAPWLNHYNDLKYRDLTTVGVNKKVMSLHSQYGQSMVTVGTYDQFPPTDPDNAAVRRPLVASVVELNNALAPEETNGEILPVTLTSANLDFTSAWGPRGGGWSGTTSTVTAPQGWVSWAVIAPESGWYAFTGTFTGTGSATLTVDAGRVVFKQNGAGEVVGTVFLTKGQHGVRLQATAGSLSFSGIAVSKAVPLRSESESLVRTASGGTIGSFNEATASGGRCDLLTAAATGAYVDYTFTVPATGRYDVKLGFKGGSNRGILQAAINGTDLGATVDQYGGAYKQVLLGTRTLAAGTHTLRLTVVGKNAASTAYNLTSDYLEITQLVFRHETADLDAAVSANATLGEFNETTASGGSCDLLTTTATGTFVEYTVFVPESKTYWLKLGHKGGADRGIVQVKVDGANLGATIDQYGPGGYVQTIVGSKSLTAGQHTIRLVVTGKNASSSGYALTADYLELTP